MSKTLFEAWGPVTSMKAFVHYPAHTFPGQDRVLKDDTHFDPNGAYELAAWIVESIRQQNLPLKKFIRKEIPSFDPSKPLPVERYYWTPSRLTGSVQPDGN